MLKMDSSLWNICNENPIGSPRLNLLRSTRNQSHSDGNIFENQPFDLCRPPEQDLQFTAVKDQEPTDLTTTSGDPQWRAWNGRSTPEENRRKRKRPLALTQRFARFYHEDDGLDLPRWTDTEIETEQTREDGQGISRTTGDSEEIKDAEYSDYVSDEILEVHERCTKPPSSDQENGDSDSDVKEVLANLEPHVPSFVMQSVSSNMEEIVSKLRASNSSESNSPDVENDFGRKIFELLKEHKEKIGQAASFQNPKKKNSSLISSFSINSLQIGESRNSPVMDEPQGANSPGERFNAVEHTIYESPELKPSTSYSCEPKTMDTSGEHSKQDNFLAPSRPPLKKPLNEKKQLINSLPDQPQINIVPGPSRTPDGIDTFMAFSESIKIAKSLWLTDKVEPIDLFRRWLPNFNFNCLGSTEQPSPNNSHKDRTSGSLCSNANGEQTEAISLVVNKKQNEHLSTPIVDTPQDEDLCDRSPNSRIPYILPSSVYTGFQVAKKRRTKVTDTRLGIRNNIKSHPEMFNGPSTSQENLPVPTNFESDEGESCGTISHFNNQLWRACEQNNKRLFTEFPKSTAPKMHSRNTIMSPISSRLSQQSESLTNHNPDITNAVTLNTSEPESFSPRVLPLAGHTEPANHPMNQNTASTEENQMRLNNFVTQDFLQRALSSALRQVPAPNQAFPTFMRALNTLGTPPDANSETHFVRPFAPPAAFINMPALSNMPDKLPYLRTSTVAAGEDCALERIPSSGISHQQFNRYNTVQDRRCLNGSILSSVTSCRQFDADTDGLRLTSTLTPVHLRKAKLMFFYTRYPNSNLIKMYFPDVKFYKNNTAQLVKWFSNFREFYYIQMEKYARVAISEGIRCAEDIHVSTDSELYRALNMHYNRNQQLEVPEHFRVVVQATLREFFIALRNGKDAEQSWKKPIYKIIARMDQPVPEFFKNPNWMEQLADS